ncbi:MAG TPA: TylF/MycF/NovP-related O-methyltransferase [Pirellulales bacterium]|jgi:predicted O-methyltransferase YrrM
MLKLFKKYARTALRTAGFELRRISPLWKESAEFIEILGQIDGLTLISPDRCFILYQFARYARNLPGQLAEVGVYRGGTALLLASTCSEKQLSLFDTFHGMPAVDKQIDHHRAGDFDDTSLEAVRARLRAYPKVEFFPGFFPDTARPVEDRQFALVHVDVDIYQSVRDALAFFYPRLVPGGIIVFDDYLAPTCPGVEKAIQEFLRTTANQLIQTTVSQCMLIKPPAT